jgi:hypothetical protein
MARAALLFLLLLAGFSRPAAARDVVVASAPSHVSVTVYRDPDRAAGAKLDPNWPRGFALVSETRSVTLPPGELTIRFEGVAEGMVAVSAIVTGLPGGTLEKNRSADLLSPAALVDGTLGNRVTLTRTNPATGGTKSEDAIVRTRADGGLVLQTREGYEAVRCSGLPEKLTFHEVPAGLSARPVFSVDTRDASGGTYRVVLTYISWGFDWQAHYVATLSSGALHGKANMALRSWLSLVNDNGESFPDAELLAVAGRLNVASDFRRLASPPQARPLRLTCYPLGSTAAGSPVPPPPVLKQPMALSAYRAKTADEATPMMEGVLAAAPAMIAKEEALGDLKLYRIPEPVTVASKGMKQVAFLDKGKVEGEFEYRAACSPYAYGDKFAPMRMWLASVNDKAHGLGAALPMGGASVFEPSSAGELLVGEPSLRDYAEGQDVELELADSTNVFALCTKQTADNPDDVGAPWIAMRALLTNANTHPVKVRLALGASAAWKVRGAGKGVSVKDGQWVIERAIPAGTATRLDWEVRRSTENVVE